MKRPAITTLQRLTLLERRTEAERYIGTWPPIMAIAEWDAIAGPAQQVLALATAEVIAEPATIPSMVYDPPRTADGKAPVHDGKLR